MEPFTHAFTSLAIAQARKDRLPRFGTTMLIVAGLAPDLDYASYIFGPEAFLRFHRTALHSLAGATVTAGVVAAAFCVADRRVPPKKDIQVKAAPPLTFLAALAICVVGVAGHIVLDLASGIGVQLLWPFYGHWSAWDLVTNFDLWILVLLVLGLLLPLLLRLVNEEVGARKRGRGSSAAGVATLVLVAAYLCALANLHGRAIDVLLAHEYHGRVALSAGAFPESSAPFDWYGVVLTDNTIETVEVPLGPGRDFDAHMSETHFKPGETPQLDEAERTDAATRFLTYARFPFATVRPLEGDYRIEIRDLRFPPDDTEPANIFVRIDLSGEMQIRRQGFRFASSPYP
ncbi:MAG TPA: metal-dependent hydrolase [Candidatus Acidoferrales bacterium]|nr:metal-dependent hydrolase [Candidatus Acidoferrales bacterium]